MKKGGNAVQMVALWLVIIGGLNWGLVGLFDWNLVEAVLGQWSLLEDLVYILVGLGALWVLPMAVNKK